jgi:hypothetical protein
VEETSQVGCLPGCGVTDAAQRFTTRAASKLCVTYKSHRQFIDRQANGRDSRWRPASHRSSIAEALLTGTSRSLLPFAIR